MEDIRNVSKYEFFFNFDCESLSSSKMINKIDFSFFRSHMVVQFLLNFESLLFCLFFVVRLFKGELYSRCRQLLLFPKQMRYDWVLRTAKSLLVVAGSFRSANHYEEDE